MIVLVVVAVLAAIAYPSYQFWVQGGRRADGTTALMDLANRLQRYYSENNTFATATIAAGNSTTDVLSSAASPQGYYTLHITAQAANTYTIQAQRTGVQTADVRCGDLQLDSTNAKTILNHAAGITPDQCW
jgi:type IV pilus assembly protein PilE